MAVEIQEGRIPDTISDIDFSPDRDPDLPTARLNVPVSKGFEKRLNDWRVWRVEQGFPLITKSEAVRIILMDRLNQDHPEMAKELT